MANFTLYCCTRMISTYMQITVPHETGGGGTAARKSSSSQHGSTKTTWRPLVLGIYGFNVERGLRVPEGILDGECEADVGGTRAAGYAGECLRDEGGEEDEARDTLGRRRSKSTFELLPTEILLQVFSHLSDSPVDHVVLALCSRRLLQLSHDIQKTGSMSKISLSYPICGTGHPQTHSGFKLLLHLHDSLPPGKYKLCRCCKTYVVPNQEHGGCPRCGVECRWHGVKLLMDDEEVRGLRELAGERKDGEARTEAKTIDMKTCDCVARKRIVL